MNVLKKNIKFIYSDWYYDKFNNQKLPFPNGTNAIIKEYLKKCYESGEEVKQFEFNGHFVLPFNHGEFYFYLNRKFATQLIDCPDSIDEQTIYIIPIECKFNTKDLNGIFTFSLDNEMHSWNLIDTLSPKIYKLLKYDNVKLIISMTQDPVGGRGGIGNINTFVEQLNKKNIKSSNVIFIGGSTLEKEDSKYLNKDIQFFFASTLIRDYVEDLPFNPYIGGLNYESVLPSQESLNESIYRKHKFISLNRILTKSHRASLGYFYEKYNMKNEGIFSFLENTNDVIQYMTNYIVNMYGKSSEKITENFIKKLPIEVDTQQIIGNKTSFSTTNNKINLYTDSYINIVTESNFVLNEVFISEKTLRPLANYQPFIVLGSAGILKFLKILGFKTFSPYIDETYDEIENATERLNLIEIEILKLRFMKLKDIHKMYYDMKQILIHNRLHLEKFKDYECFDEVINNII